MASHHWANLQQTSRHLSIYSIRMPPVTALNSGVMARNKLQSLCAVAHIGNITVRGTQMEEVIQSTYPSWVVYRTPKVDVRLTSHAVAYLFSTLCNEVFSDASEPCSESTPLNTKFGSCQSFCTTSRSEIFSRKMREDCSRFTRAASVISCTFAAATALLTRLSPRAPVSQPRRIKPSP
jgi:hypothetical protein